MPQSRKQLLDEIQRLSKEQSDLQKEKDRLSILASQLGDKNQELRTKISEKDNQLNETNSMLDKVLEKLKKLARPPFLFANFIEMTGEKEADVLHDGKRKRVGVNPEIDERFLMLGVSVVILESTNAIFAIKDAPQDFGDVVILQSYLEGNRAIVEDMHGTNFIVYVSTWFDMNTPVKSKVLVHDGFIWSVTEEAKQSGSQYLLAENPDVKFEDIGGLDEQLLQIKKEIEDSFEFPELYDKYGIPKETHIFLYGLPGNGKTMIAKAIAKTQFEKHKDRILKYAPGNFFVIRGPELEIKWVGESERMLREVFDSATELAKRANAPVFIFFDDCEAFLLRRGAGISSDVNMGHVTQFATLVDGVREIRGVNLILASNRLDLIDPAVIRRMSLKIRVPEPDKDGATKIFTKILGNAPLHKKYFDLQNFPELRGDRDLVLAYMVEQVIQSMYEDVKTNDFVEIMFGDDTSKIVKVYELISGKIIADIMNRAKKLAKDRDKVLSKEEWPTGVTVEDILEASRMEFKSNEGLPSTKEMVAEWLKQKGFTKEVVDTRKLFGEVMGETKTRVYVQ
ncbi:MAG: Proteasome-associated ATPase [Candidatus Yanofskybacteria bacterium GW2011_GWA1_39_13]|uniref:Proteasome-associated ATPase n=2 Tax=Patescibacteria group TaxID=1783273 RepID=A0A0G0WG21_9BACT|nr:MAG: Proteasome-associated ATPase [Candidatus Yanofskybacteria bacterium GW2011_GWA1_39_13]KKS10982.1 MAG: Proteasome-associated ATPase [Candidatus Daviesbacteria bacterium GW2011_GWB1_41_5]